MAPGSLTLTTQRDPTGRGAILLALLLAACACGALWFSSSTAGVARAAAPSGPGGPGESGAVEPEITHGGLAPVPAAPAAQAAEAQAPADAPARAPLLPEPSSGATLRVELVDAAGHRVQPGRIELRAEGRAPRFEATGPDGYARFEQASGELLVLAHDLPEGWLEPWGQERCALFEEDPEARAGRCARRVRLESAEAEVDLQLCVFRPARASGRVLGLAGEPVEGVGVRLQASEDEGPIVDVRTDRDGAYVFEGLYPGAYELCASPRQAALPENRSLPPPRPLAVTIEEGQDAALEELHLRRGVEELCGRVLDQDERAVRGLTLEAWSLARDDELAAPRRLAVARTDEAGAFALFDLPAEPVRLLIGPDLDLDGPWQERLLAQPVEPLEIDLGGDADLHELGTLHVVAARPFRFHAVVRLDEAWARAEGLDAGDLRARVEVAEGTLPEAIDRAGRSELQLDPLLGEVAWVAETPHPAVLLFVRCGELERSRRLEPLSGASVEDTIVFP